MGRRIGEEERGMRRKRGAQAGAREGKGERHKGRGVTGDRKGVYMSVGTKEKLCTRPL